MGFLIGALGGLGSTLGAAGSTAAAAAPAAMEALGSVGGPALASGIGGGAPATNFLGGGSPSLLNVSPTLAGGGITSPPPTFLGGGAPSLANVSGGMAPPPTSGGLASFGQGFLQGLQGQAGSGGGAFGTPQFNWPTALGQIGGTVVQQRSNPMLRGVVQQFGGPQQQQQPLPAIPGFPQLQQILRGYNGFY